jgi:hypothetical protein
MPILYHSLQRPEIQGASVENFLKNGLESKQKLMDKGVMPFQENAYERAVERYEKWVKERTEHFKNDPETLESVLKTGFHGSINGRVAFEEPGFSGNRNENIFFTYLKNPPSNYDWVAIEVPNNTKLHDATCRDLGDPVRWQDTAVTIEDFANIPQGKVPFGWEGNYNEYLVPHRLSADQIVAYAKVEKELPIGQKPLKPEELTEIRELLNARLDFATQFTKPESNVLINESNGKYQIRISFNKDSAQTKQQEITEVFQSFNSIDELLGLKINAQDLEAYNVAWAEIQEAKERAEKEREEAHSQEWAEIQAHSQGWGEAEALAVVEGMLPILGACHIS